MGGWPGAHMHIGSLCELYEDGLLGMRMPVRLLSNMRGQGGKIASARSISNAHTHTHTHIYIYMQYPGGGCE